MTRFMMSIDGAVDLVLWAFEHGDPGDIFVQKAPAATIETLAQALKQVFKADNPIQVIGTRHGEKLYETLLTREEMAVAEDMGDYYRVPADNRDLNYGAVLRRRAQRSVGEGRLQQPQHQAALGRRDGRDAARARHRPAGPGRARTITE